MWNPLRYRADRPTKGWHKDTPRTGRKNHSQEPNYSNSLIRDQIVRSRPERGDPILKEYRSAIQSKLRYDRVWEKHTRPAGWPHREGLASTTREGAQRVFVPIEIWDKIDPTGWPHREDSNQTPGRLRKRHRSDRGLRQARPGRVTPSRRHDAKTEAEIPKELRFRMLEVGQMGEAGEHTPEPTNWRGSTTNGHSQSWDSTDETSRGPSMDARPAGRRQWPDRKAISQGAPQWARKQGWTPTRTAQTAECDGARERRGPTGRLPAPRSQKRPDRWSQTREREPRPTPGENTQGKTGKKSIRTRTMERTGRPNPHGNLKVSSRDGATGSDRSRGERKANSQTETAQKRLNSTGTEWMRHIRPEERERSPGTDPSDDAPTRKRDEWKARTRTEGDSKAPSASIATSTCLKARARGKHTRNVVTTPDSVRGEEKSREQAPVNRPEERMGPQDTASLARYR